jgi:hypothetical protein
MTWKLTHNGKVVNEWSEELLSRVAQDIKDRKFDKEQLLQNLGPFLPDPLNDALGSNDDT